MSRVGNLDDLLGQLEGSAHVKEHIKSLLRFGLVFEESQPETLRLYGGRITRGCRVDDRSPDVERFGQVVAAPAGTQVEKGLRPVRWDDAPDAVDFVSESALVPIAEPNEPVYPVLEVLESIRGAEDSLLEDESKPHHIVIEGENFHALQTLRYTHEKKVDVIYIDPPYNTGGDLIYNDKYLAKEDSFRHSKWLSFMDRRLRVARELLKDTGVIIVAIDDNEQAHLRLLMDEIFQERNFIANVVWNGGRKNNARYVSTGHDYMLVYAKSGEALTNAETLWREEVGGIDEVLSKSASIFDSVSGDRESATRLLRQWVNKLPETHPARGRRHHLYVDEAGRAFNAKDSASPGPGGARYEVLHPTTGKPCEIPGNGWRYTEQKMRELLEDGSVFFGDDESKVPRIKNYLDSSKGQVPTSVFELSRNGSTSALARVFPSGEKRFLFPKDTNVLARWIGIVTQNNPDAVILDFFGGSGSTAHAVMEMNAADNGNRQCILITNNEVEEKKRKALVKEGFYPGDEEFDKHGIFRHVTYPRLKTVVTGTREDGSKYSDGLPENITFTRLSYSIPASIAMGREFNTVAPLMWMKAGGTGEILSLPQDEKPPFVLSTDHAVLFDTSTSVITRFVEAMKDAHFEDNADVFIVTDDDDRYARACARLSNFTLHRLYEDYLSNFEVRA